MQELLNMIKTRRSVRRFRPEQITHEELQAILQAGLWAPSAGGRQSPIMLVCQNAALNDTLGRLNRAAFGPAKSDDTHFVSKTQKSIADDDGIESGFYGAPTVVALCAPEGAVYGVHDCSAAAENMCLAAWGLGIGSCYVGRAEKTFESVQGKRLMLENGIGEFYKARVCLCLGYPEGEVGEGKPRLDNRVKIIV